MIEHLLVFEIKMHLIDVKNELEWKQKFSISFCFLWIIRILMTKC